MGTFAASNFSIKVCPGTEGEIHFTQYKKNFNTHWVLLLIIQQLIFSHDETVHTILANYFESQIGGRK